MDPALRELVRRGGDPDDELAVVLRLADPDRTPAGVRLVARFGEVATARIRRSDILALWSDAAIRSVKAPRLYGPDLVAAESAGEIDNPVDRRRPVGLAETGRGVVIGVVDWGCDFAHPDLRRPDGRTRLLALWDQRPSERVPPAPYGYGRAFEAADLNRALAAGDPFAALDYHPADFDAGMGAHGTHTLSIAAGNGRGGGPAGMAPEADCAFVNLGKQRGTDAVPLGNSAELLEAVDFLVRLAGDRPLVINASLGRHAGMHTGRTLVERALDHVVSTRPGTAVTQSAGNYFERRTHGAWQLHSGERRLFTVDIDPDDRTPNEIDVWYPGRDRLTIVVSCPALGRSARVPRGAQATLQHGGRDVARIYHRAFDPNSGDNQCSIVVQPDKAAPTWEIMLIAEDVVDGRVHAWIERDSGCRGCQSRLAGDEAVPQTTTGTIANGFRTLVVGAVDDHQANPRLARFSSSGPTRDGRQKPDLLAPGVMILGARSHPPGPAQQDLYVRMSGTSMAAPLVAGAVALLFERHGRLAIEETRRAVLAACTPLGAGADPRRTGAGLLDVRAALDGVHPQTEGETIMAESNRIVSDVAASLSDGWDVTEAAPFRHVKVAVVGGGLSGLMAARTLAEAQFNVTLFEASDRLGGRVWTRTDLAPGRTLEAGAELIGRNHPLWVRLADSFGLTLQEVTSEDAYCRAGLRVRWRYGGRDLTAAERAQIKSRLAAVLDLISREAATVDRVQPWASPMAAEWDRISVAQRLRRSDMFGAERSDALRHLEFVLANDQCAATEHQSYLGLLAAVSAHRLGTDLGGYWKHTEDFRCLGGSQQLAQRLSRSVRRILLSTPVDTLQIREDSARLTYSRDQACTYEDFDFVILATPPTVWPEVVSDPAFPARHYTMAHGPAVKYLSVVRSRFWLATGLAPNALWDELGSVWEGTDGQQPRAKGPYGMSVYAGGPIVRPAGDYAGRLEILYPGLQREATHRELVDWPERPWCRTGYSVPAPGQVTTIARNLSRPFRGRLFFAGEQASPGFFGYMEGALQAGLRAAQQVVVAAVRSAPASSGRSPEVADAAPLEADARELVTIGGGAGTSRPLSRVIPGSVIPNREEEQERRGMPRWTPCFGPAEVGATVRLYEKNVDAAMSDPPGQHLDRASCIVMLNVGLGQLLGLRTKDHPARGRTDTMPRRPRTVRMGDLTVRTVDGALNQLVRQGRATGPLVIDFNDHRGRRAGTLPPVSLRSSVSDAVNDQSPDSGCWYAFGLSLVDATHSVLLLVDHTGPTRRLFWLDQFSRGLDREVTTTLDAEITDFTQRLWQRKLDTKGIRFSTQVRLWRLRSASGADEEGEWWREGEEFFPRGLVQALLREPTVGFEFDVHYGPIPARPDLIDHTLSAGTVAAGGFKVKLDGPRLEINTRPFEATPAGRLELEATAARIAAFAGELNAQCKTVGPGVGFSHPDLTVPVGKLPTRSSRPNCSVWAAPQATITVRLSKVSALVDRIRASEGRGPGAALSGDSSLRMGLRSEALYRAQREVKKARRATPFSADLEGFLILLASYLWSGELPYRYPAIGATVKPLVHDYEEVGKAFLPINVKNPFSQVFATLLSSTDQQAFRDNWADGAARANLYRLARPSDGVVADGSRKFLPTGKDKTGDPDVVHAFQRDEFGVTPTWDDLVAHTLDPTHRGWGDRLLVTHSTHVDVSVTRPRVLLELRRAGFTPVDRSRWTSFMLAVRTLTADLDR